MPKRKISNIKNANTNDSTMDKYLGVVKKTKSDENNWIKEEEILIYNPTNLNGNKKIYGFDLDWTLITPKSGKRWPKSWDDWQFMLPEIPGKLKSLNKEGSKVVIFTNQGGVEKGKTKIDDVIKKFDSIREKLGFEFQIFASLKYYSSLYRKPCGGMFNLLQEKYNGDVKIDKTSSYYVGDAAGRSANWIPGRKKDFSANDRLFAANIGLNFQTPEQFFLNQKPVSYPPLEYEPRIDVENNRSSPFITDISTKCIYNNLNDLFSGGFVDTTLIILVGFPGCGKSTFVQHHLQPLGFNVINRDTLKTQPKCLAQTEKYLEAKTNVVIDNTNPDKSSRSNYIEIAKKCGVVNILAFVIDVPLMKSKHNEMFRRLTIKNHNHVGDIVYNMYKSKYSEPIKTEGFTGIYKIVPNLKFDDDEKKDLYSMYLVN